MWVYWLSDWKKRFILFTAVTVDADNQIIDQISSKNIQCLQLHGSETNERIEEIKNRSKLKIIKTIQVKNENDIIKYKKYINADYILFDTPSMEKSIEFPKNLISKLPQGENYALAGSVSEDNLQNINKLGVNFFDLSSSLESQLGYKDHLKIKSFMIKINELKN